MSKKNLELKNDIKFCIDNIGYLLSIIEKYTNYNNIIKKHILILLKVNYLKIQDFIDNKYI